MEKAKDTAVHKIKITYTNPDFSAFFVENLVRGLHLEALVSIVRQGVPNPDAPASVTNVRLTSGETTLYGELTIGDFLVGEYNRGTQRKLPRLTQDL